MNYELIMLRSANRIKYCDKSLSLEIKQIALTSYAVLNYKDGTMGQIRLMSERAQLRDKCRLFWQSLVEALKIMPKPYCALLVTVYFKKSDIPSLCARFKKSKSTLYRKLWEARNHLKNALTSLGYDEKWFKDNFSDMDL